MEPVEDLSSSEQVDTCNLHGVPSLTQPGICMSSCLHGMPGHWEHIYHAETCVPQVFTPVETSIKLQKNRPQPPCSVLEIQRLHKQTRVFSVCHGNLSFASLMQFYNALVLGLTILKQPQHSCVFSVGACQVFSVIHNGSGNKTDGISTSAQ